MSNQVDPAKVARLAVFEVRMWEAIRLMREAMAASAVADCGVSRLELLAVVHAAEKILDRIYVAPDFVEDAKD